MAKRGDDFTHGYTPQQGDIVHLNWQPSVGSEMIGPHYGLVVSQSIFNIGTGLVMVCPITSKTDKLSGFDLPIRSGRVKGAAVLSQMRTLDYMSRSIAFEGKTQAVDVAEASRRIKMIF